LELLDGAVDIVALHFLIENGISWQDGAGGGRGGGLGGGVGGLGGEAGGFGAGGAVGAAAPITDLPVD
jgi:hypothetical protein